MKIRTLTLLTGLFVLTGCAMQPRAVEHSASPGLSGRPLKIASWNLEFLAEKDGAGCEPRTAQDYQAMRRIADGLDADVIAFQEAESLAAAARVFDLARYTVVMETRPGKVTGTCGGRHLDQPFIRQAVGFAVKRGIAFDRNPDVTALMLGNPQLRSGIDITVRAAGYAPIRLLGIHLKGSVRPVWQPGQGADISRR